MMSIMKRLLDILAEDFWIYWGLLLVTFAFIFAGVQCR